MIPDADLLLPRPHHVEPGSGACSLAAEVAIERPEEAPAFAPAVERLTAGLAALGLAPRPRPPGRRTPEPAGGHLRLAIDAAGGGPESYRLDVTPEGIEIEGADAAGLFYGAVTLLQWLTLHHPADGAAAPPATVPCVTIRDRPDLAVRGVLIDVSRDKVPTMETLYALVDRLAGWKINQLQLYTEHTFAYEGHETVWRGSSPLTADEVRELDAYCRRRSIELVPNQNSFGHFHRWLSHPEYRHLAECPEGVEHPFGDRREPFSLCPDDPGTIALLEDLYDQLLPHFSSRMVNVGLDETFDLGRGRSAEACEREGKGRVYLRFLQRVHQLLAERGRRMQFWGDIVLERPELIGELPEEVIALAWGYEADHPFRDEARHFADSGRAFYLCPGTSSWNSFAGRLDNAVANLAAAASAARETGAAGYLVTDWGDHGHLQPLPVSYPGLATGAACGWNAEAGARLRANDPAGPLARHLFGPAGEPATKALVELANAYLETGTPNRNGSALFFLVVRPDDGLEHDRYRGLSAAGLERVLERSERARALLADGGRSSEGSDEGALVRRELTWVADLLTLAAELGRARLGPGEGGSVADLPSEVRRGLRRRLDPILEEHGPLWAARNRAGGQRDSLARLERLGRRL